MKTTPIIFVLLSLSTSVIAQNSSTTAQLETSFRTAFNRFQQAILARDAEKLQGSMTSSAYMAMKNESIAHKLDFPKDFFEGMGGELFGKVDLQKLQTLRAKEKNGTGAWVTFAPASVKFMGDDTGPMLVTFMFIKEGENWKYDHLGMEGIEAEEESSLLKGDLSKINNEKYEPSGVIPPVPAPEAPPDYDYDAILNVVFGDDVEITLNGKLLGSVRGSQRTGVKKGENTIVIKSTASDLKISLYARKDYEHDPIKVFEFDEASSGAVITKKFQVKLE